jgi:dTDP-glucose pyrophosphorylase
MKVCITAAGLGTRMGEYGSINKALLPVEGKAAISHIIESFPADSEFVVALGHNAQQVRDYLILAHPSTKLVYVNVPQFEGPGTGPLLSLYACRPYLREPFFFVACDTLPMGKVDAEVSENTIYFGWELDQKGYSFVHFDSDEHGLYALGVRPDAPSNCGTSGYPVFTGMMAIRDFDIFWDGAAEALARDDAEIFHALNPMIDLRRACAVKMEWRDIGTRERYRRVIAETTNFDFSKPDEFIYTVGDRVIKWFAQPEIARSRVTRAAMRPAIFPEIEAHRNGFYSYRFLPGTTLYEDNNLPKFAEFLEWMLDNVWQEVEADISESIQPFYVDKTLSRLGLFREKYPDWKDLAMVNGEAVLPIDELLERIDLNGFAKMAIPSFIHGDLQFDNIIHGPEGFRLLDWRQDFGGRMDLGDIYYDLAKLLGGIRLNYSFVKRNLLSYEQTGDTAKIDVMQGMMASAYEKLLLDFIRSHGFSVAHTEQVLGVIFLNMAPLHHEPFDKFLYALAQRTLTATL